MKQISLALVSICMALVSFGQSKYDHREAFHPFFYPNFGTEYRSASGEPGPKYWQNKADYKIDATLDPADHSVKGTVALNYINNSPDALRFLWLQLDQNIYRKDSRASATTTAARKSASSSTTRSACSDRQHAGPGWFGPRAIEWPAMVRCRLFRPSERRLRTCAAPPG